MSRKKEIIELIYNAIDDINGSLDEKLLKSPETSLYGKNSKLDSLGLVNLIVSIEENIEDELGIPIVLADERAMSQKHSPFRTVESLTDFIEILIKESNNE